MSVNLPIVKINTPQSNAKSAVIPDVSKKKRQGLTPSFGFKPIEVSDEGKVFKFFNGVDEKFDSAWQRLVSGATAIILQPGFDLNNKNVDEETRKTSCARTISKIAVGTATGVAIRALCIKALEGVTKNADTEKHLKSIGKKFMTTAELDKKPMSHWLLPKKGYEGFTYRQVKKYRGALGTFIALGVMFFTNFLIDAPLTMKLTNYIAPKFLSKTKNSESNKTEGGIK